MNENLSLAKKITAALDLPMKVISVEEDEEGVLTFHFSSETRVDYRELVKKFQEETKRRISMHQVGSREEAKLLAGVGPCGQRLCCATFLKTLPVLSADEKNEEKLGACGKAMCCLAFQEKITAKTSQTPQKITPEKEIETSRSPQRVLRILPRKKPRHRR